MAYTNFTPSDINDMLSQVNNFASQQLGWSSSWSGSLLTLTPKSGQAWFELQQTTEPYGTSTHGPAIYIDMIEGADQIRALLTHVSSTSMVWLYGGNDPEPWLLITILAEPGVYRHAFVGYLVKYGTWGSGALCDAVNWSHRVPSGSTVFSPGSVTNSSNHMLFSFNTKWSRSYVNNGDCGGIFVRNVHGVHPRAVFNSNSSTTLTSSLGQAYPSDHPRAGGGFTDAYAEWARTPGVFPNSGEAALVPITLFADMLRNDTWTPLGHVPGLRMVNITELDPEGVYSYAGQTWKIFPLARKTSGWFNTGNRGIAVLQE